MKYFLFLIALYCSTGIFAQENKPAEVQFLGVLTLADAYKTGPWTDEAMQTVGAHFKRLMSFNETGKVVFAGRTQYENDHPDLMGLVVFYATTLEEAIVFMNDDPAVKGGIMKAKVHPYQIAVGKQ